MLPWHQRSEEEAYLFNPAFCAVLIASTVQDFSKQTKQGLTLSLVFVILPVILHKDTRRALPSTTATSMLAWLQSHKENLIGFAERCQRMRLITREAIIFGVAHEFLEVGPNAALVVGRTKLSTMSDFMNQSTDEVRECVDRARFFGRWLARAGTPGTIMASWGVAP
jgi:hypothetical protein